MSQNASNLTLITQTNYPGYISTEEPNAKLVIDFSIFFIVGPVFLVFCLFILWWDFFYGARVVANVLCMSPRKEHQTRKSSSTSSAHVQRNKIPVPQQPDNIPARVQRNKSPLPHQPHTTNVDHGYMSASSSSSSLPRLLEHTSYGNLISGHASLDESARSTHRNVRSVPTGHGHQRRDLNYRDPPSGPRTISSLPSHLSAHSSNSILPKLSIERRSPPTWNSSYNKSKPSQRSDPSASPSSDSVGSSMIKVRSDQLQRRMSQFFPEDSLRRFFPSGPPILRTTASLHSHLSARLSNSILPKLSIERRSPPIWNSSYNKSKPPRRSDPSASPMKKTSTADSILKSRLEDFIPNESSTAPGVPTLLPTNSIRAKSPEGNGTRPESAAVSISTVQFELTKIESTLKSELQKVEEKIENMKHKPPPTKEELKAKLRDFIPIEPDPPKVDLSLSDLRDIKSDIVRPSSNIKPTINHISIDIRRNDQRANTWQMKTALYE